MNMAKRSKKLLAYGLSLAMAVSAMGMIPGETASAAKKKKAKVTLSASKLNLTVKQTKTLKVKKKNVKKIKSTKWKSNKKKVATVSKKGKVTAKAAGTAKITATVKYIAKGKKKTQSKKLTCTVKVKKAGIVAPTKAPTSPTAKPTVKPTVKPTATVVPTPTAPPALPTVEPFDETSNLTTEHESANGIMTKDNGQMRDMDSNEYMRAMGLGWNYGNSLEQSVDTSKMDPEEAAKVDVNYCETSANIAITQKNITELKRYGFKNVRIPVAWSNLLEISGEDTDNPTYTINEGYMDRVEEVINYCLNEELYVIINIHYDGDWWGQFGDADEKYRKLAWARYRQLWTQIATRYAEYSDRLIFESANEELGDRLNDDWRNRSTDKTGVLTVDEQYETMNKINQEFVNIVRSCTPDGKENNKKRYLLIAGYSTNIGATCDERFKMPVEPEATADNGVSKLSVSVHFYSPWNYCGGTEYHQGEGMAPRLFSWGTDEDVAAMYAELDRMKKFTEAGYGVIIGEYGVQTTAADGIPTYIGKFAEYALAYGMIPVLWDNGTWFDRTKSIMAFDNVADAILKVTGASGEGLRRSRVNTSMPLYRAIESEEGLTLKYTWEGEWSKNGGSNDTPEITPSISSTSEDGKWTFHCNTFGYWSVIYSEDLKSMTQPYVRVSCKDGNIDDSALQLSGADFNKDYPPSAGLYDPNEKWMTQSDYALEKCKQGGKSTEVAAEEAWDSKIYAIDPAIVKNHDCIWISASNKPVFTKIEVFDGPEISWK